MTTIRDVAQAAGVSTATVSAVINESAYVSPDLKLRVLNAIDALHYKPSQVARNLRRGRTQLVALVVADLANPFYSRIVTAAEAAVSAWGYSLVIFNSDEKPDAEQRSLDRIRQLGCDGAVVVPVGAAHDYRRRDLSGDGPIVLLGRSIENQDVDTVTIDNVAAGWRATGYLLDLGHTRIGAITGPAQLSTGRGRFEGMRKAMEERGLTPRDADIRCGEFREDVAYSVARDMLQSPDRPTALYVANGVMALGVMRALADLNLTCPGDVSIASTDTIAGIGGLSPRLTRTEHPVVEMTNEAIRMLIDRIGGDRNGSGRNVVFQPTLVVADSCAPIH
ncbi:MAG: LacI family DNA-binding transcriptional regulator [Rhodobiaceae bacterium]|nr:LacI family DNA-binding transcriptional regulator [Rhodobiaceae bacterium]